MFHPFQQLSRDLELCKLDALSCNEGNYDSVFRLSGKANYALDWFISNCRLYSGACFVKPKSVITLTTDASTSGWGVFCNEVLTSGLWSSNEQALHLNCFSVWCSMLCSVSVLPGESFFVFFCFCDNSMGISYIDKLGGMAPIASLHAVSKSIWEWCLSHHCLIEAYHVPGSFNVRADFLSRNHNRNIEWKLHPTVFLWVLQSLFVPDIDLFASRLNFQTQHYVSWFPDPGAFADDAFSLSWKDFKLTFFLLSVLSVVFFTNYNWRKFWMQ